MFSKFAALAGVVLLAQTTAPLTEADLARLEREATARAQKVAVAGGPSALATEIARELSTIGQYEDFYLVGDYAPALKNFPGETVTAFRAADVEIQYNLLFWSWRRFSFPAMAPVLKALYQSPPEDYAKMRDLALRRFFDLTPGEARPFMLEELQRTDLRVSMTTLGRLGDASFPEFEPAWLRNLANGILDERIDAAVRIERFGSPAIRADVRRLYDAGASSWSCEVRSAVLGYLARVDKAGSAALVRAALQTPAQPGEDCGDNYARADILRPVLQSRAPLPVSGSTIVLRGPVPGDEWRVEYAIGDQTYRTSTELINRLMLLPSGTTMTWTYATGTAATNPERWTMEERRTLLKEIQEALAPRNIRVEPLNP